MENTPKALIIGAGITGLSAGWKLSEVGFHVEVFEKNGTLGGLAATLRHGPYAFDLGPHKLFTLMEDVMREIRSLVGDDLLSIPKRSRIRLNRRFLNYPVGMKDLFSNIGPAVGMKCALSYLGAVLKKHFVSNGEESYRDWITNRFGGATYDLVFGPYATKIWGDPGTLSKELAETRVAVPDLFQMVRQMILGLKKTNVVMSAEEFFYPRNGIESLPRKMAERILEKGGAVYFSAPPTRIHHKEGRITGLEVNRTLVDVCPDDVLISTIPLRSALHLFTPAPPGPITEAGRALKTRNLILLYIIAKESRISEDNWIFFPGSEYVFNRTFEQKGFSPYMVPENETVLCVEITCSEDDPLWDRKEEDLFDQVMEQLEECGLLTRDRVQEHFDIRLKQVYPIYDRNYRKNRTTVLNYLDSLSNFYTIGRHGAFNYVGIADCMDMGFRTARHVLETPSGSREALRKAFDSYIVID